MIIWSHACLSLMMSICIKRSIFIKWCHVIDYNYSISFYSSAYKNQQLLPKNSVVHLHSNLLRYLLYIYYMKLDDFVSPTRLAFLTFGPLNNRLLSLQAILNGITLSCYVLNVYVLNFKGHLISLYVIGILNRITLSCYVLNV